MLQPYRGMARRLIGAGRVRGGGGTRSAKDCPIVFSFWPKQNTTRYTFCLSGNHVYLSSPSRRETILTFCTGRPPCTFFNEYGHDDV